MRRRLPIAGLLLLRSALSALASPQFFTRHDIHTEFDGPRSLYATDVDGDVFRLYTLTVVRGQGDPTPLSSTYQFKMSSFMAGARS